MKSLDTNVLAQFFINDPEPLEAAKQRPAAAAAMAERGFIPVTVLLEFEWVLVSNLIPPLLLGCLLRHAAPTVQKTLSQNQLVFVK